MKKYEAESRRQKPSRDKEIQSLLKQYEETQDVTVKAKLRVQIAEQLNIPSVHVEILDHSKELEQNQDAKKETVI